MALNCGQRDGHDFVRDAVAKGASMVLVSRLCEGFEVPQLVVSDTLEALQAIAAQWRKCFKRPVIGVTGSCGKTSTKDLLAGMLGGRTHATYRNQNNFIGLPLTLCGLDSERHEAAVIEVGINEPGEMQVLADMLSPDVALVTMVGRAHLEKLCDLETVAREKAVLGEHVREGGRVIFTASCARYAPFRALRGRAQVLAEAGEGVEGFSEKEVVRYALKPLGEKRQLLKLSGESDVGKRVFALPLLGPGMTRNAALAALVAIALGVNDEAIQRALEDWRSLDQRGELRRVERGWWMVDCYNANPDSFMEAFARMEAFCPQLPRLYVLGGMEELGEGSDALHEEVGKAVPLRPQDKVILVGERARAFERGLRQMGTARQYECIEAIDTVRKKIETFEGVVLLKGSRACALERCLPSDACKERQEEKVC